MANWCRLCQDMAPIVARIGRDTAMEIRSVDVDKEEDLVRRHSIRSVPTFVILDGEQEVDRIVGTTSENQLRQSCVRVIGAAHLPQPSSAAAVRAWEILGVQLAAVAPDRLGTGSPYRGGLEVTAVRPDSPAARQSIRAGDILVGLHVWETVSTENVEFVLHHNELPTFVPLKFYLVRKGAAMYGYLDLDKLPVPPDSEVLQPANTQQQAEPAGIGIEAAKTLAPATLPTY
jgi:thiol-disulfide isomerase/thioredoxin